MTKRIEFVELVVEQMSRVRSSRARAMFGGHGVYCDGLFIALIADEELYFKADAITRGDFEALGLPPFTYTARGKTATMQYFQAPPEVFENTAAMQEWMEKAIAAAKRAKKSVPRRSGKNA